MEQFKEIITIVLGCVAILGSVYALAKYFSKLEQRANGNGKCKPIFICPYIDDIREIKISLSEVREDVAELKGTVSGISTAVNFLSTYIRKFSSGAISQ